MQNKKVQCNYSKYKGKYIDRRTQQEHITLADSDKSTKITKQLYISKHNMKNYYFLNSHNIIVQKVINPKMIIQKAIFLKIIKITIIYFQNF